MLNKKIPSKKKILFLLKQKGNLEVLITTFAISLLTIAGVFTSHYNSDKFSGTIKVFETVVTPENPTNKFIAGDCNETVTTVIIKNIDSTNY